MIDPLLKLVNDVKRIMKALGIKGKYPKIVKDKDGNDDYVMFHKPRIIEHKASRVKNN